MFLKVKNNSFFGYVGTSGTRWLKFELGIQMLMDDFVFVDYNIVELFNSNLLNLTNSQL